MKKLLNKATSRNTFLSKIKQHSYKSQSLVPKALALKSAGAVFLASILFQGTALADVQVKMHKVTPTGPGESLGTVTLSKNEYGVVFTPELKGLASGLHGFHVHENASCEPKTTDGKLTPAGAAGGHMDTKSAQHHATPWGDGHIGDLPALYFNSNKKADSPVLSPRLTLADLDNHALMIHKNGDNYADEPLPLGGGGSRVACGIIKTI